MTDPLNAYDIRFNELSAGHRASISATLSSAECIGSLPLLIQKQPWFPLLGWSLLALVGLRWLYLLLPDLMAFPALFVPALIPAAAAALGIAGIVRTTQRLRAPFPEGLYVTARDAIIHRAGRVYAIPSHVVETRFVHHFRYVKGGRDIVGKRIEFHTATERLFGTGSKTTGDEFNARLQQARVALQAATAAGDLRAASLVDPLVVLRASVPTGPWD